MPDFPAPGARSHDFGVLLNLAFAAFKGDLHDALARAGFDDVGASFGYVFRLLADGPMTLREVAQALEMSAPGALKIVNDMVGKGYVRRLEHAGDARQKPLELAPRARQAMAVAHGFHGAFEAGLAQRLGAADAAAARRLLEAIVEAAARRPGAAPQRLRPL